MIDAMEHFTSGTEYPAPDEPLPDMGANDNEEDSWETEEEEEVFVHCLGDEDKARRNRSIRFTSRIDYKARLLEERKQWQAQEEELTLAYMRWKAEGDYERTDEDGLDQFDCKMISLDGKHSISIYYHGVLMTMQLRQSAGSNTKKTPPHLWLL